MDHVTPNCLIDEIINKHPGKSAQIVNALQSIGLQCVGCGKSTKETLFEGMQKHGYSMSDTDELCKKLVRDEEV